MKKRFLHILFLILISSLSKSYAQCTVKNVLVKLNSTTAAGSSCILNFDFIFTIQNNGGNKYIYIHSWLQSQYPNHFGCPNMAGNLKAPRAADLVLSKINLGIDNDISVGPVANFTHDLWTGSFCSVNSCNGVDPTSISHWR
jgi:hypothetical protein